MPSAAETTDVERQAAQPKQLEQSPGTDLYGEQPGGPLSAALSGAFGEPPSQSATTLLRKPALSHRANNSARSVLLKRAQHAHGNRYVQRLVSSGEKPATSPPLLQRQCACGTCETCRAP